MSVVIRLARAGKRNRPFYKVMVADEDFKRDGRYCEKIGTYNPLVTEKPLNLEKDRYDHWVKLGAQPSDTVRTLVKRFAKA